MTEYRTGRVTPPRKQTHQTFYARALRLKNIRLSSAWSVVFFEGSVALAVLLALTEQVSWWVVLALPLAVAAMVKINDVIAGATKHPGGT
ncbi:hypothetical protein [Natronoglycomyces albus]|uniref:Uncharacterized protein n=1 Tax=Natronoglycomyces albus TaxID=2811108 RepID=A0A895XHR2_9ACTN|nr:hypothetical protein [Natronoglycomyces albus]QSB04477.1 hypothetical protein JQS30_11890 [Natronoglycomyces albus]